MSRRRAGIQPPSANRGSAPKSNLPSFISCRQPAPTPPGAAHPFPGQRLDLFQPRATPCGWMAQPPSPERAGQPERRDWFRPFRASTVCAPDPGRCPGLECHRTVGAHGTVAVLPPAHALAARGGAPLAGPTARPIPAQVVPRLAGHAHLAAAPPTGRTDCTGSALQPAESEPLAGAGQARSGFRVRMAAFARWRAPNALTVPARLRWPRARAWKGQPSRSRG